MYRNKRISIVTVGTVVFFLMTGCSGDPKVRRAQLLKSGQSYMDTAQYETASIQFRRAIQIDPQYAEAHYRLAGSFAKLGRVQDAYRELQKTIELDKNHTQAHLGVAELLLAARQTADARQEINAALAIEPGNLNAHLILGSAWVAEGDYKRSLQEFTATQKLAPTSPIAFAQAGTLLLRQGEYSQAIEVFRHATEVDGTYIPAYLDMAQAFRAQGNADDELATLQKAIERNPRQVAPYVVLAGEYIKLGHSEQVTLLLDRLRTATSDAPEALLAIGEFYFRTGDALRAREIFTQALSHDSKNNVVRQHLIEVVLSQQDWDEGEKLNKELLRSEPRDVDGRLFEARLQFARGAKAKAIASLEQLVHDSPELPLPHFYLGLAYAGQGQAGRAIAALNDTVERSSNFIWAYVSLGELHAQQGSPKLALEFAQQALKRNPRFLPALLLEANAHMQIGDLGTATRKLTDLLAVQPGNAAVLERLAITRIAQKQYPAAERYLESALMASPNYAPALLDLIQLYKLQNGTERIIARVQQQIDRAPNQSSFYEMLGGLLLDNKNYDDAEQAFSTALNLNANATVARLQLSRVYAARGKLAEAIASAKKLLELHPDYLVGYVLLGSLYQQNGDLVRAEQAYQEVLQRNEDYVPALNNLAWLYCENSGNLDMALSLAQKAKARIPNDPAIADTLAWIEYRKGLYSSAVTELQEVTRHSSRNSTYQYHLGMALWRLGKPIQAKRALQQALDLQLPSDAARDARTVLAQLTPGTT